MSIQERSIFINNLISYLRDELSESGSYSIQSRTLDNQQNPQIEVVNGKTHELVILTATEKGIVCNDEELLMWENTEMLSEKGESQEETFSEIKECIQSQI